MTLTITYRGDGDWGTGKGGNLTPAEVDGNFWAIAQAIESLSDGPAPAEIDEITLLGTQLTFTLTDARTFGPYTLPLAEPFSSVLTRADSVLTLSLAEAWSYVRCTATGGCEVTVPANATVSIPVGTEFRLRQSAAGAVTLTAADGVTLNLPDGASAETIGQGAVIALKKVATDAWDVFGALVGTGGGGGGLSGGLITGPLTVQRAVLNDATGGLWPTEPGEYGSNFVLIPNEGAFELYGFAVVDSEMVFLIENGPTAGAVTFGSFAKVTGDAMTTVDGDAFIIRTTSINGWTIAHVTKLT